MRLAHIIPLLFITTLGACGSGEPSKSQGTAGGPTATDTEPGPEPVSERESKAWDPAAGVGKAWGFTVFKGDPPKRRKLDMGSDPTCADMQSDVLTDESVIIDENGALANVFVYVRKGLEGWDFPVPTESATISQKGCVYEPHVIGVQVGQAVSIVNEDLCTHNVHCYAKRNTGFNKTQAAEAPALTKKFERAEVFVTMKCDIHGWMNTNIGVVEHSFFGITSEDGSFDLGALPPGSYQIAARHEVYGLQKKDITVTEGVEPEPIEFTFVDGGRS